MKKPLPLIFCLVLLGTMQIALKNRTFQINSAKGAETGTFSGEMSQGFINGTYGDTWYVWLNTSGAHLLFLTMYSITYPSAIDYFVGQHYFTSNGTEVFIGNRLLGFEIYEDVNENSILDVDFANGFNNASDETRYFFMLNASQTVDLTPPSKNMIDNVTHYTWSVKHGQAQGNIAKIGNVTGSYLGDPETNEMVPSYLTWASSATLNQLNFTFNYWVDNNTAYLKTGLEFGTFSKFEIPGPVPEPVAALNFGNYSLSAIYSTTVLSMKAYEVTANSSEPTGNEVKMVNSTSIDIETKEAFRMIFGQNYTLSGNPTPQKSTAGTYPITSLPNDVVYYARYFTQNTEEIFKQQLAQTSPSLSSNMTLGIRKSSIIYRICYPTWQNQTITHDPLYIAHIGPADFLKPPNPLQQIWLIATLAFSTAVLIIAIYRHTKIRTSKLNNTINTQQKTQTRQTK